MIPPEEINKSKPKSSSLLTRAPGFIPVASSTPLKQRISSHPSLLAIQERLKKEEVLYLHQIVQVYPNSDLAALGYQKWEDLLAKPEVQDMLNADFVPSRWGFPAALEARSNLGESEFVLDEVNYFNDEQLRYYWKLKWKKSLKDFCEQYQCNIGHFSSWLNQRRLTSPASSGAIRRWMFDLCKY